MLISSDMAIFDNASSRNKIEPRKIVVSVPKTPYLSNVHNGFIRWGVSGFWIIFNILDPVLTSLSLIFSCNLTCRSMYYSSMYMGFLECSRLRQYCVCSTAPVHKYYLNVLHNGSVCFTQILRNWSGARWVCSYLACLTPRLEKPW